MLNIGCAGTRIQAMTTGPLKGDMVIDAGGRWVAPGIIDVHTHIRDMELSQKEDWVSASAAAARGGITTVCDMPNTRPATFDAEGLRAKWRAAARSTVNYGINFGVTEYNHDEMEKVTGINAFKIFMAESSAGYVVEAMDVIRRVMEIARRRNIPLMVHSELQSCVEAHHQRYAMTMSNHHLLRHRECAIRATERLLYLQKETGAPLYIAHVSTAEEIELIARAKQAGQKVWCEVTPHHLFLDHGVAEKAGHYAKVNPPLREKHHSHALQQAVADGVVDTIGTDHAPHTLEEKARPYPEAPSGFPGLETSLGLMLQMYHQGQIDKTRLEQMMCTAPARIFNMKDRGILREGAYADIIIVDEERPWRVDPAAFFTKARYSPFKDMLLKGQVITTIVNGQPVWHDNRLRPTKGMPLEYH